MGLAILILGLVVFIGTHLITTRRGTRAALIGRFGEGAYKGLYSAASILGVVLIGWGFGLYRASGWVDVWYPPAWTRHVTVLLVWIASVCVVAAYSPGRIKTTLKHPMLVGVKLWAFAHLISNGDLGSIILFGSILGWAVFDRISLKHRADPGEPPIPVGGPVRDVVAVVGGTALFLALGFLFHPYVVGVPAFGR
ncbi:MAG: NnrU family protein [Alphaproteobacteria bacterium]|nr:MAG: NnrU family protein [Alphaproteobacteria bacterium]